MISFSTPSDFVAAAQQLKTCTVWTADDRLLMVAVLAHVGQHDVMCGAYGRFGSPNFTSILHAVSEPADTLNRHRDDVVRMVDRFSDICR